MTAARSTLAWFREREESLVALLEELLRIDSPTGDAEAVGRFVARYRALLEDSGLECRELPGTSGPHLWAFKEGVRPGIVFCGHADTVWPRGEAERRPPRREEGKLYGPGVFDMKSGLLLAAAALRYLNETGGVRRRIDVFVAADEEVGSPTAHPHMERCLSPPAAAIVPEPPGRGGAIKIERKGVAIYRIEVEGREAHAGVEPERGVHAIAELARIVLELQSWNDPERGITVNTGTIEGGTATNVVPARAACGVDVRFPDAASGEEIERRLQALRPADPRARIRVRGGVIFPPLRPTPQSLRLARIALDVARRAGLELGMESSGGGSDGAWLAARGFTVLDGVGADGGGAHSLEEHIDLTTFPQRGAFFALLMRELDGKLEEVLAPG